MQTLKTLLIAATLTAASVAIIATVFVGARAASERRAEYLEAESAVWECIESGLSRAECVQGVF